MRFLTVLSCKKPTGICEMQLPLFGVCGESCRFTYIFSLFTVHVSDHNFLNKSSGFTFAVPKSIKARMAGYNTWDADRQYHENLVSSAESTGQQRNVHREEIRTTPLFSGDVLAHVSGRDVLPQYGFLAKVLNTFGGHDERSTDDLLASESNGWGNAASQKSQSSTTNIDDSRLFINMNAPWSAFICGSQGSGKSHTLS